MSSVIPDSVPSTTWAASPAIADVNMASHKITNTAALTIGSVTVTSPSTNVLDIGSATGGQLKAASASLAGCAITGGGTGYYDVSGNLKSALSLDGTGALAVGTAPLNTSMKVYRPMSATGDVTLNNPVAYANGRTTNSITFGNSTYPSGAQISMIDTMTTGGTWGESLALSTSANGPATEKMRIDLLGNVGIGTTNPRASLQIGTGDGDKIVLNELAGIAGSKIASTSGYGVSLYSGPSAQNDGGYFTFNTSNGTGYAGVGLDGFRVLDLTMFTEKVKLGALAGGSTNGH